MARLKQGALGPSGGLIVDKPRGPTSHDVVRQAKKVFQTRSVGHAGTLDPMATGVLVVLVGEATKLSGFLTAEEKSYRAVVEFGRETDSLDADGEVTRRVDLPVGWIEEVDLDAALAAERKRTEQTPPAFSAISVDGERSHRRMRRGEAVALPGRPVAVSALEMRDRSDRRLTVELVVSKGYYVRSFARDLGAHLGVPAHLVELRRLSSGQLRIEEAVSWPPESPPPLMTTAALAGRCMPSAALTRTGVERAGHGKPLRPEDFTDGAPTETPSAWIAPDGALVAVGRIEGPEFRVTRGFGQRS